MQVVLSRQRGAPFLGDGFDAVNYARQSARHAAGSVGVLTEVHGFEHAIGKSVGGEQAPEGGGEGVQDIAAGGDGGLWLGGEAGVLRT